MKRTFLTAIALSTALTAPGLAGTLTRVATVPLGAEITGMFLSGDDLFFNVQHPWKDLGTAFSRATVGVVANADFGAGESPLPEGADKRVVVTSLGSYQILFQHGDFGVLGSIRGVDGEIKVSNDPDFNAFVPTGAGEGYLFTNWEDRPGGMSRVRLTRAEDGTWAAMAEDATMLDFMPVQGTWVNCFGTLSPWGTPLSSEELYFDSTRHWNEPGYDYVGDVETLETYLGAYPNPYRYGYIVEITDPAGAASPVKRVAMGRSSHENAVVMPDRKTVYLSDDGTNVVFYKFVADVAGDLSAGTLFAAKITQEAAPGTPAGEASLAVRWIELAHGTQQQVERWIAEYDGITQDDFVAGANSYISDAEIEAWARGEGADDRAAFLESRKAAAARGATAEFRKMEGMNINLAAVADGSAPYMYMSMSEVSKGMTDDRGDIRLAENRCGVVYEMQLDADFNVSTMVPAVVGGPYDRNAEANACAVDGISNPDNIVVLPDGRVLIGEDTGSHENNAMWLYTPDRAK